MPNPAPIFPEGNDSTEGKIGSEIDLKLVRAGWGIFIGPIFRPREMAAKLFEEEVIRQILTSLVICLSARNVYTIDRIVKCLNVFEWDLNETKLSEIGRKILLKKIN